MKKLVSIVAATALSVLSLGASSDYTVDYDADYDPTVPKGAQDIVITFSHDLVSFERGRWLFVNEKSVEQACLALTMAQLLRNSDPMMNGGNEHVNVTIFMRNDGVKLADPELVATISKRQELGKVPGCVAPWYPEPITLEHHLQDFLNWPGGHNNLVNCPICWCAYRDFEFPAQYAECESEYSEAGADGVFNPAAIPQLFLGAEKVIDF